MKRTRFLTTLLALCLLLSALAVTASGATASGTMESGLKWSMDGGKLTISGEGAMDEYFTHDIGDFQELPPWWDYRSQITTVEIKSGVTRIGAEAFYECTALRTVKLPATLKDINPNAFAYCSSLTEIVLPEGFAHLNGSAFMECTGLKKVTLPDTLVTIERNAFKNCISLTSVTLPKGLYRMDGTAFSGCRNLSAIRVASGNERYYSDDRGVVYSIDGTQLVAAPGGLSGSYTIPATVDTIADNAFEGCVSIREVIISKGVQTIGYAAFYNCTGLEKVSIPTGITEIPVNAFCGSGLTTVVIPNGVTRLDSSAFNYCLNLQTIVLPGTLTEIGDYTFSRCDSLTQVHYTGTAAKWKTVTIGTGNEDLTDAARSYNTHKTHSFTAAVTSPKCTKTGYTTYTCSCGISYKGEYTNARGHNYTATLGSNGYITYDCSRCSSTYTSNYRQNLPQTTDNRNDQDYTKWNNVINSYLVQNSDGTYTRVEYYGDRVCVEQYDENLTFLSHGEIAMELPLFGGYYSNGTNHFLVFGQTNPEEDDAREVIRVVKYSSGWKRQGSAHLYGFNTTYPFEAGSLAMTSWGDTLYVRTCHQRYTSSDGLRHQTGVMLTLRISDMAMLSTDNIAYVSHSFNQLVTMDGVHVIMADHGDAYPRAIQLAKNSVEIPVLEIGDSGSYHYNYTGASIGGLAVSGSNYLLAGNSIKQDGSVAMNGQRNIFLTVTGKTNFSQAGTKLIWLTKHTSGVTVSTPHLVKVSDSLLCVLWTENGVLHYTFVNGAGKKTTDIFESSKGAISDCAPIFADGKILWYVTQSGKMDFYTVDPEKPGTVTVRNVIGGDFKISATNQAAKGSPVLSWNSVSGAAKYKVYRATSENGSYSLIKTVTENTFRDDTAKAGTKYYYYVSAVNASGSALKKSNTVSRTADLARPVVSLSNKASNGKIVISWKAISGAGKYEVYRATSKDGTYSKLGSTTGTTFTNSSVEAGKQYYYKVKAIHSNSAANSAFSAAKYRTADLAQPVVTLSNKASNGKIVISWKAISGASKYEVYRATSKNGTYSKLGSTTGTTFTNSSVEAGTKYYYKVKAIHSNSAANSAFSAVKNRTADLAQPVITLSNKASNGKIVITWKAISGASKYEVWRSTTKDGTYSKLGSTAGTTFTNSSVEAGKQYYYKVKAIYSNSAANSAFSAAKYRTADLAQPKNVKVALTSAGKPKITWDAVDGAVKYTVYRATAKDGTYTKLGSVTGTQFINSSAVAGKTYYYKVIAVHSNTAANSAYSAVVSVKT